MQRLIYRLKDSSIQLQLEQGGAPVSGAGSLLLYDEDIFHLYHEFRCEQVVRLVVVKEEYPVVWFWAGVRAGQLCVPYSSPFSLVYLHRKCQSEDLSAAIQAIPVLATHLGCHSVKITLPPPCYDPDMTAQISAALAADGFQIACMDLNAHFDLADFTTTEAFLPRLGRSARRNYRIACDENLSFIQLDPSEYDEAYTVIERNRQQMGYPLRLSRAHVAGFVERMPDATRWFGIRHQGELIATGLVFDITPHASQLIYWGDDCRFREKRSIALLAMRLVEFYHKLNKCYLDIGPSSDAGILNHGLSDFKRSMGCHESIKLTFTKDISARDTTSVLSADEKGAGSK